MNVALRAGVMAAIAALAAGSPALADVKSGVDAWASGNYEAAVKQWTGPAADGDADAQFNLGQAYKLGRGVKQDLARAEDLFGKAAASGHLQASDNFGLLLFQRGERAKALPYVTAAAGRGDPRAQYLLGLAHFNGDLVAKDWVRAYALVSLAQQSGLPQAAAALAQMDQHIPIEQRRDSIALATRLAADAQATRRRQVAAVDLGAPMLPAGSSGVATSMSSTVAGARQPIPRMPVIARATEEMRSNAPPPVPARTSPAHAGADYTASRVASAAAAAERAASGALPPKAAHAAASPAAAGPWRIQLGAFGVAANADRLWNQVKDRPELAGKAKAAIPAGRVTKLQATGFGSQDQAQGACRTLASAGFDCIVTRN